MACSQDQNIAAASKIFPFGNPGGDAGGIDLAYASIGYRATMVAGVPTQLHGAVTGDLPGRVISSGESGRGPRR